MFSLANHYMWIQPGIKARMMSSRSKLQVLRLRFASLRMTNTFDISLMLSSDFFYRLG